MTSKCLESEGLRFFPQMVKNLSKFYIKEHCGVKDALTKFQNRDDFSMKLAPITHATDKKN